jgi:hypothetical protein
MAADIGDMMLCKMPPGGDELNVAVALSLLGVKSKWVSDSVADSSIFPFCFFESEFEACQNCIVRRCVTQQNNGLGRHF